MVSDQARFLLAEYQLLRERAEILDREGYYDLATELRISADQILDKLVELERREREKTPIVP